MFSESFVDRTLGGKVSLCFFNGFPLSAFGSKSLYNVGPFVLAFCVVMFWALSFLDFSPTNKSSVDKKEKKNDSHYFTKKKCSSQINLISEYSYPNSCEI